MDEIKYMCPTTLFSTVAIITASLWGFWCRSFKFDGNSWTQKVAPGVDYTITADDLHFSPWYQLKTTVSSVECYNDGNCYVYTSNDCIKWGSDEDTKWNFAKVASAITVAFGGFLTILVLAQTCVGAVAKMWHCIALTFILVCALFQGLTFLIYNSNACNENPARRELEDQINSELETYLNKSGSSFNATGLWDDDCSWDKGSSLNVVAIVFWFLAGVTMLVVGAPPSEGDDKKDKPTSERAEQAPETSNSEPDVQVSATPGASRGSISVNA